ncbi:MFS transporter [Streptomyces shenzhenensis]|uniref:MFS transporter n=1 Tax=Streptomyces shenzhenensis TaxID=943815 RepID=UPI0037F99453
MTNTQTVQASSPPADAVPRRWWALAVIGTAQLMVVLDATIVNIALPTAQADLGFSDGSRQWVVTAYALAFGSLLLVGGRIADMLGRRRVFLLGLVGFAAASALGGAAPNFTVLITARALQGLFGALLAPAALAMLSTLFSHGKDRARAFGVFGAIAGSGSAIGLLLGGLLTEYLTWRWTLLVNLAFAAVAFLGALFLLPRASRDTTVRIDIPGALFVSAGLFAVVYGFSNAEQHDWSAPSTWGTLTAGAVLLLVFVRWQRYAAHPLLPLRVLADRNRGASYLSVGIVGAAMFGVFLFLTYYLQQTLHFTPVRTGLAFMPMVASLMVASALSTSVLLPRIGPKPVVPAAMLIAAAGMVYLTRLDLDSTYSGGVLPATVVVGLGIGGVIAPAMSLATHQVADHDAGVASATVNTAMQIGGSLGTALLNTLATSAATRYLHDKDPSDPLVLGRAALESYSTAYAWSAGLFAAGCLITLALYRRDRVDTSTGTSAVHM